MALRKTISIASASFDVTNDHDGHEVVIVATQAAKISLPSAVGFAGAVTVKASKKGAVVLHPASGQLIDGQSAYSLDKPYAFVKLLPVGDAWAVVAAG